MKIGYILAIIGLLVSCGKSDSGGDDNSSPKPKDGKDGVGNLTTPETLGPWKYVDSKTDVRLNDTALPLVTNQVLAVGDAGTFLESNDNGLTWQKRAVGTDRNLNVIRQVNQIIYVAGDSIFLLSTDEGKTFAQVAGIDFVVRSIAVTTSEDGAFIAVGDKGRVARASLKNISLDKIKAEDLVWESVAVDAASDLTGVSFSFANAIIVGKGGFVASSKDIGKSFVRDSGARTNLDFLAIDDEFMAGNGIFAKRFTPSGWPSGSISWRVKESSDLPLIRALWCTIDCMAVGENGDGVTILKISDEGNITSIEAKNLHTRFYSIENLYNGGQIAVGDSGKILLKDRQQQ